MCFGTLLHWISISTSTSIHCESKCCILANGVVLKAKGRQITALGTGYLPVEKKQVGYQSYITKVRARCLPPYCPQEVYKLIVKQVNLESCRFQQCSFVFNASALLLFKETYYYTTCISSPLGSLPLILHGFSEIIANASETASATSVSSPG